MSPVPPCPDPASTTAEPDLWMRLRALTPARVALGRTGASLTTDEVLRFAMAHARARDAVHAPLDVNHIAQRLAELGFSTLSVASTAPSRAVYLRRPDLGRRLSAESRSTLAAVPAGSVDLAIVVADGLSSAAIGRQVIPLLEAFAPYLRQEGWSISPIIVAIQARVALGDEIGSLLRARAVVVLVGERPGLSSADSLGAYLTHAPRVGCTDAQRNCLSNIRPEGLRPEEAAFKLHWLLKQAFMRGLSGVDLKDESDRALTRQSGAAPIGRLDKAHPSAE